MHKKHTPQTVVEFVDACKSLDGNAIYELFEYEISDNLRNEIYGYSRPYSCDPGLRDTHTSEPCREAMYTLGTKYNVQSLIDY